MDKEIEKALLKSKELLESMSALELMENAGLFNRDLNKLVDSYNLPAAVLVGCLMQAVYRLNKEPSDIILDDMLGKAFLSVRRYVDTGFMKKE